MADRERRDDARTVAYELWTFEECLEHLLEYAKRPSALPERDFQLLVASILYAQVWRARENRNNVMTLIRMVEELTERLAELEQREARKRRLKLL